MMDPNRWINTLHTSKKEKFFKNDSQIDSDRWVNTISTSKSSGHSIKKYSITATLFILGLIIVSVIKNETRNLQKEIDNLNVSINTIELDLYQSYLDYDVISSPENISRLAQKYLESDLVYYKSSQLLNLNGKKAYSRGTLSKKQITKDRKKEELINKTKSKIKNKIKEKRVELAKLQALYNQPEQIPKEMKSKISNKIISTKKELKKLYSSPKEVITVEKAKKWAGIQIVKAFLGIPVIPGK